jgi:hypothetical protein
MSSSPSLVDNMSPNPAGKKLVTAHSKISFVSGGSVRNAVWVSSQCDPTIVVICMKLNLAGVGAIRRGENEILKAEKRKTGNAE